MAKKKNDNVNVENQDVGGEQTTPKTASEKEPVKKEKTIGIVNNCVKLNIRKEPKENATVVTIVPVLTELVINENESSKKWFSVTTPDGVNGFCKTEFVKTKK